MTEERTRAKRDSDGETYMTVRIKRQLIVAVLAAGLPGGFAWWKASSIRDDVNKTDQTAVVAATTAATTADATRTKLQLQASVIAIMRDHHAEEIEAFKSALLGVARRCLTPAQYRELKATIPVTKEIPPALLEAAEEPIPSAPAQASAKETP
jgi:hypothetical protein